MQIDFKIRDFYDLRNLFEQYLPEHSIKIPSQSADKFASSCHIDTQIDLLIQFGWQFSMVMRSRQIC
jgi:hypothetical protein